MLRSGSIPPGSCAWGRCRDRACLSACSGYLPPCGGGRLARQPKSAIADFGVHIGQVGNIRLGMREPGGGCFCWSQRVPPSPSLPHKGGGRRVWHALGQIRRSESSPLTALAARLLRDTRLAVRVGGGALMGVLFFLLVVTMVPFGVGPDLKLLARIGPAILWLGALLATLLGLDRLLAADHDDGSLDLILMSHAPLELAVAAKAMAHWLTTGLPLVIAAPLFGIFLNIDGSAIGIVALTLLVGTPALTFIGLIGAALAVALQRGGLLLPVLVLPLTVPVLIFGISAADAAIVHAAPFGAPFLILIALTLTSVVIGPVAAAAVLRHGLD